MSERYNRRMIKTIAIFQNRGGSFSVRHLKEEAGIDPKMFYNTVRRPLNRQGRGTSGTLKSVWPLHEKWNVSYLMISGLLVLASVWMGHHLPITVNYTSSKMTKVYGVEKTVWELKFILYIYIKSKVRNIWALFYPF